MVASFDLIAHRAGNSAAELQGVAELRRDQALDVIVEVDVHLHRGRLEVRHGKLLWPTKRLWERWYLLPAGTVAPSLDRILEAAGPDQPLWLDLKGPDRRLARALRPILEGRSDVTVSSKAWWVFSQLDGIAGLRRVRSAGNRFERLLLRMLPFRRHIDGVVLHERLLDQQWIERLRGKGGQAFAWAIEDRARAEELLGWGVRGLIIDDLDLIAALGTHPAD